MKKRYLIIIAALISCTVGCTKSSPQCFQQAQNFINKSEVTQIAAEPYPAKDPVKVVLYKKDEAPIHPYKIIAKAKISQYNIIGFKRQSSTVNTLMKNLAAKAGGDGVININNNHHEVQGSIITFKQALS